MKPPAGGTSVPLSLSILLLFPALCSAQIRLSLKRAVEIALSKEGNARVQIAAEAVKQAEARSRQARSALLPNLDATVAEQNLTRNLEAMGLRTRLIPRFVGPFNVFDARASVQQSVLDFSSIRRYQASRAAVSAAREDAGGTEDQIAAQAARAYLELQRADARLEAVHAAITLAEALVKLAENQKAAGEGTGIEVTRARVQLANERQRLLVAENGRTRARLQLLRVLNLRLDSEVELTDPLSMPPVPEAAGERKDFLAQQEREANARLAASAASMERMPSVAAFADYGSSGTGLSNSLPTRTYGVAIRVPIFDGGRREAHRAESAAQLRQEEARTRDLRQQIDMETRIARDSLRSAGEQVKVAEEGFALAEDELAHARRRFQAGVAPGIEVTDAQTRLERARDNRIEALFNYNQARIDIGQATGTIRSMLQ